MKSHTRTILVSIVVLAVLSFTASTLVADESEFVVTSPADAGDGSLRQAILDANASPGTDVIRFDIPGSGPHTIALLSGLPAITEPIVIDGTTQAGASCESWPPQLAIELDGSQAGDKATGLLLLTSESVVRGLVINQFGRYGVGISSTNGSNRISCNFIGTDLTGTTALPNGRAGILLEHSPANMIGGLDPNERNLISGNRTDGVVLFGSTSFSNQVQGNFIGTDVTGTRALGNQNVGIFINDAPYNEIGGSVDGAGNVISGNGWEGIYINQIKARGNVVAGNFIGTDASGTVNLGNADSGIVISHSGGNLIGGHLPGARNLISGNGMQGVYLYGEPSQQNVVIGNYIGSDISGGIALGNGGSGVYLDHAPNNTVGGLQAGHQNLIVGNQDYGIYMLGMTLRDDPLITNWIGMDATGETAIRNGLSEMHVDYPVQANSA